MDRGVDLPALAVVPVYRADSSGTTATFTRFLSQVSGEFRARIGNTRQFVGRSRGRAATGSDGVSAQVQQTSGAVGYVELNYALRNQLTFAEVANAAGRFVAPTIASTSAAAKDLRAVPRDLRVSLVGAREPTAYPVATWTILVVFRRQPDTARGAALAQLLWYATHQAQAAAVEASIGVAIYPEHANDPDELLQRADIAGLPEDPAGPRAQGRPVVRVADDRQRQRRGDRAVDRGPGP